MSPKKRCFEPGQDSTPVKKQRTKPFASAMSASLLRTHPMSTRLMTMTAARTAVLQTTELLTMILSHLSPIDLLRTASKVNTTWYNLVTIASPTLQAKAYLTTLHSPGPVKWYVFDQLTFDLRLYHYGDHKIIYHLYKNEAAAEIWFNRQLSSRPTILNPLILRRTTTGGMNRSLLDRAERCESLTLVSPYEAGLCKDPSLGWIGLLKKEGFWGKMLLCQPGVDVVEADLRYDVKPPKKAPGTMTLRPSNTRKGSRGPIGVKRPTGRVHVRVKKQGRGGVTIGDFMKEVVRVVGVLQGKKDVDVEIRTGEGRWGSVVWLLGAVMVTEQEEKAMEGRRILDME